jgi:hypothetical protein
METAMSARLSLRTRTLGAAAVIAALAGTVALPAVAANAATPVAASAKAAAAAITAHSSVPTVAAWHAFQVTGTTSHLPAGTHLTVQQLRAGHWVSLPAVTSVTRNGSYTIHLELGLKGVNKLRLVGGGAASNVLTVTVR